MNKNLTEQQKDARIAELERAIAKQYHQYFELRKFNSYRDFAVSFYHMVSDLNISSETLRDCPTVSPPKTPK